MIPTMVVTASLANRSCPSLYCLNVLYGSSGQPNLWCCMTPSRPRHEQLLVPGSRKDCCDPAVSGARRDGRQTAAEVLGVP